ncbi:hypothetical protein BH11ARM1_BH11ARM1_13560 [soil metagenome]
MRDQSYASNPSPPCKAMHGHPKLTMGEFLSTPMDKNSPFKGT